MQKINVVIRQANSEDLDIIKKLNIEVFEAAKHTDPHIYMDYPNSKQGAEDYLELLRNPNNCKLIALIDTKVAGYLIGGEYTVSYRKDKMGEIYHMGVTALFRRNGVGTSLIKEFKQWCVDKGYKYLYVNVNYLDEIAVKFYSKQGLRPLDIILVGPV
jgi:ribosomal protein S18 acetylase RimI-like enzyme